jgi:hypothetical protein
MYSFLNNSIFPVDVISLKTRYMYISVLCRWLGSYVQGTFDTKAVDNPSLTSSASITDLIFPSPLSTRKASILSRSALLDLRSTTSPIRPLHTRAQRSSVHPYGVILSENCSHPLLQCFNFQAHPACTCPTFGTASSLANRQIRNQRSIVESSHCYDIRVCGPILFPMVQRPVRAIFLNWDNAFLSRGQRQASSVVEASAADSVCFASHRRDE